MTDVERFLNRYYLLSMQQKQAENDWLEAKAEYEMQVDKFLKPAGLQNTRVQTSNKKDPVADAVVKMVDVYAKRMEEERESMMEMEKEKQDIDAVVQKAKLNPMENTYIKLRYFKGEQARITASKMSYSVSQARRYKQRALAKIDAVIKCI